MERFHFENPSDPENEINVFVNESGGLSVSVAEETAMDSYNTTIACNVYLDVKAAMQLRDYLNLHFSE